MRKTNNSLLSVILLAFLSSAVWANSEPVVSSVTASQRTDGSKKVDIRYNLSDADGDKCTISVQVSADGGATWNVAATSFSGDVGSGIKPGTGRHIVWEYGKDLPGEFGTNHKVKVTADGTPAPPDMVLIPGGTFQMGDPFNEGDWDEKPVHAVYVDSFYMSSCEITNGQYCEFLNSAYGQGSITVTNGIVYKASSGRSYPYCATHSADSNSQIDYSCGVFSVRTKCGRDMSKDPMVQVSWYGAVAYCNWRSQKEGYERCYELSTWECDFSKHGYRLPTEAEWEYAARGGLSGKRFPWGDTISHSQANYDSYWLGGSPYFSYDLSPTEGYHPTWKDGIYPYTSPAGSFSANGYGLYDMAGNVWEWCNDWYLGTYYSSSPSHDPTGGPSPGIYRVLRGGGSWNSNPNNCRVANRGFDSPNIHGYSAGFRLSLDLN